MIEFRCWFCNKRHVKPEAKAGRREKCSCHRHYVIPYANGGCSRRRTLGEWVTEVILWTAGGGLLGLALGLFILVLFQIPAWELLMIVPVCAVIGLVAGLLGGEEGVNGFGRVIRWFEEWVVFR